MVHRKESGICDEQVRHITNTEWVHLCSILNEWSNSEILFFTICSYAEVRAERRRELGIEESLPETAADKVCYPTVFKNYFYFFPVKDKTQ